MTGTDYVRESIAIFEKSLEGRDGEGIVKTVAELAGRTGYSVYHFTRLFSAVAGVYPKEYISGRILSEAARRIAETDESLARVARGLGFPDYETFSRAFKKRFGQTPSAVRALRQAPAGLVSRLEMPSRADSGSGSEGREPSIVERKGFHLTGLSFFIERETVSFHRHWGIFMKAQKKVVARAVPERYCQFTTWTTDESVAGMAVLCALETDPSAAQEPLFSSRDVPPASYLRFTHAGDVASIGETYRYIYQTWFAAREAKPLDLWEFQLYRDGDTEIYIPMALR